MPFGLGSPQSLFERASRALSPFSILQELGGLGFELCSTNVDTPDLLWLGIWLSEKGLRLDAACARLNALAVNL